MTIEINVSRKGPKTEEWLQKIAKGNLETELARFGQEGVNALSKATPVDTGLSAESWDFRVVKKKRGYSIEWFNTDRITPGGPPVVVLIQYGHATKNGAWVKGRDFINPAMRPVFDKIVNEIWKKVKNG